MTRKLSDVLKAANARPYSLCKQPNGFKHEIVAIDGIVCTVAGTSGTKSETEANALLLAHAANQIEGLVEASEAFMASVLTNGRASQNLIERLQSALAKATTIDL